MKQKRWMSRLLLAAMLCTAFTGMVPASAEQAPQRSSYYDYTMGEFVSGHEGYAFEKNVDYGSVEEMKADTLFDPGSIWDKVTLKDGAAVLEGRSKIQLMFPDKDEMGHSKATDQKSYALLDYAVHTKNTLFNQSPGVTIKYESGAVSMNYTTTGSDTKWQSATQEIQNFDAGDRMTAKVLQDATQRPSGGKLKMTVWMENQTKNTGFVEQLTDKNPRYSSANRNYVSYVAETMPANTGKASVYGWKMMEQFEYLLRETVGAVEGDFLGDNQALNGVTKNLNLHTDLNLALDKGFTGTVTWESTDNGVIDPATGAVTRSTEENKSVTLTATYQVSDATATKEKVIAYPVTVLADNDLRDLAEQLTWNDISNGQTADRVTQPLDLIETFSHESVPGVSADVSWSEPSATGAVDLGDGTVTRMEDGDAAVELVATLRANGHEFYKTFNFTVPRYVSPEEEVADVLRQLEWGTLSTQPWDAVTEDLTLPPFLQTMEGNQASVDWTVLEGDAAMNSDGTVTQGNTDVQVKLQAAVSCNGAEKTKEFTCIVLARNEIYYYANEDFAAVGDKEIEETKYAPLTTLSQKGEVQEGAYAKFVDGKGLQMKSQGAAPANDYLTAQIDLRGLTDNTQALDQMKTITSYEIEANIESGETAETYFRFQNAAGKNLVYTSLTPKGIGVNAGGWQTKPKWSTDGTYTGMIQAEVCPRVIYKVDFNNQTGTVSISARLPEYAGDKGYDAFVPVVTNYKPSQTGGIAFFSIDSRGNNHVNVRSVKYYTTSFAIKAATSALVEKLDWLGEQDADFVTGDLTLEQPLEQYGAVLDWEITPAGLFDSTGKLLRSLEPYETVAASVRPVVTFSDDKYSLAAPLMTAREIKLVGLNEQDLALNCAVKLTGAQLAEGSNIQALTDGNMERKMVTTGAETSFELLLDLEQETLWNVLKLSQGEGENAAACTVSVSNDRRNWKEIYSGPVQQQNFFENQNARYVKYTVTEKKNAAAPVELAELEIFFEPTDEYKLQADYENLKGPLGSVDGDLTLAAIGDTYASPVTWTSSQPEVLRIASAPVEGVYHVAFTKPSRSCVVTLTATVGGKTKSFPVNIQGSSYGGGGIGGGGGGGSHSGGGGTSAPYVPAQPNNGGDHQNPNQDGFFQDVDGWAQPYVDKLYQKGIVRGDAQGNFNPEANVSRAEYIKMLILALDLSPENETELPFTDISADHWARPYIAAAYRLGIVNGVSETEFGLDVSVSRQDLAVMTDRAMVQAGKTAGDVQDEKIFTDADQTAAYAQESIARLQRAGIISGAPDGGFHPQDTATRAESAKILCGIIE